MSELRRRIASGRIAPMVAFPGRVSLVGRYDAAVLKRSARWLVRSREHANLTCSTVNTWHGSSLQRLTVRSLKFARISLKWSLIFSYVIICGGPPQRVIVAAWPTATSSLVAASVGML